MGIFKKKPKIVKKTPEEAREEIIAKQKADLPKKYFNNPDFTIELSQYRVKTVEFLGTLPNISKGFLVWKVTDMEDKITFLQNEKNGFMELFPSPDKGFFSLEDKASLRKQINELEKKKKEITNKLDPGVNGKDIEYSLRLKKAQLRAKGFESDSSYIGLEANVKTIYYKKEGSDYVPLKWDKENETMFFADDNKKKGASISIRNKQHKYAKFQKLVEPTALLLIMGLIFLTLVNVFWTYKNYTAYDDSNLANLQRTAEEGALYCSKYFSDSAKDISIIMNELRKDIKPDESVKPKDGEPKKLNPLEQLVEK